MKYTNEHCKEMLGRVKLSKPESQQAEYCRLLVLWFVGILWPPTWSINNWFMIMGCKWRVWSWQSKEWGSLPQSVPQWSMYWRRTCIQVSGGLVLWMFQYFHCLTVGVGILIRKQEHTAWIIIIVNRQTDCDRTSCDGGFWCQQKNLNGRFQLCVIDGELSNFMVVTCLIYLKTIN